MREKQSHTKTVHPLPDRKKAPSFAFSTAKMEVDGELKPSQSPDSTISVEKEGRLLLGTPTFADIGSGRLRCVETGHELVAKEAEAYGKSKGCRVALIDYAVAKKKPPLNVFKPDPLARSKLICKLTGYTINKTEEHIWKHITGKRFLYKLEQKEVTKMPLTPDKSTKKMLKIEPNSSKVKAKKGQKKDVTDNDSAKTELTGNGGDSEEIDFWMPPIGERWDFDDGKERWNSGTSSGPESEAEDNEGEDVDADECTESADLSTRTKRMSIVVGPSSFASRKKKTKINEKPNGDQEAE